MTIANGINKIVVTGKQSAQGTIAATDLATAQTLRFQTYTQDETHETYTSNENRPDKQLANAYIGPQDMPGSLSGELTPGTHKLWMQAINRKDFVAGEATSALTTVTAAATSGAQGTFTRSDAGSYITDGFKLGDVVRWTGWATDGVPNNAHNFLIVGLTALVMTVYALDGTPPAAKIAGDSVTCTVVGKKTWMPTTAHTEDWFTNEINYNDLDESEVFYDCKISTMAVKVPASGISTIDFSILGLNMTPFSTGSAPYFSAALAITTTDPVLPGKGVIFVSGTQQTLATGMDFDVAGNQAVAPAVIGTNVKPGISDGRMEVKGNLSFYFDSITLRDAFRAGTEISIYAVFPCSDAANADFLAFTFPFAKITGASKSGDKEIVQSLPFTAQFNRDGAATTVNTLDTTMSIQDSTLS